jgi:hypothetical protein
MWGFKNARDRKLAKRIFELALSKEIADRYNPNRNSPDFVDEEFLKDHVFSLIKDKSLVHDSFYCHHWGGNPWPTRRLGNCFVGKPGSCDVNGTDFDECPVQCRPKEHTDWKTC